MTEALEYLPLACPYCGQGNLVEVDRSSEEQRLIEDCTVCCRPIDILCRIDLRGEISLIVHRDDD